MCYHLQISRIRQSIEKKTRNIPETLNFETNDIISKHSLAFIKSFQFSEEKYLLFSKAISNGHVLH